MGKRITRENYITIQGWMITDFRLKGLELLCYAVIYGFSQDSETRMTGGLEYLQSCTFASRPTIIATLKKLVQKQLIIGETNITDCKRVFYHANLDLVKEVKNLNQGEVKEFNQGELNDLTKEVKEFNQPPFNIKRNSKEYIIKEAGEDFLLFWNTYDKKVKLQDAIKAWKKLSNDDRTKAIAAIKPYQAAMRYEKQYFKYPSSYLNQRTWEDDFSDYTGKTFYEIREDDTDKEKRFKEHMRKKHPAIEQVRCPLSMCAYIDLANVYGSESVEQELTKIENNIALYKLSDISYEIAKSLEKGRI